MALDLKVHHYEKEKLSGQARLTKVKNYLRVSNDKGQPPVFIQNGKLYSQGGPEIKEDQLEKDFPWFKDRIGEMKKTKEGKKALSEVKYGNRVQ